ncbi:unnamed protein product [Rhizoctonia solani]|uniref:Protein kinase domain-containing protein n=1 Tax=Rhizoctonia solani TaxID=456999 RepID=A0A8H3CSP4_9AGAM|nr:unnamed protein product [Rhizoctonia solani]
MEEPSIVQPTFHRGHPGMAAGLKVTIPTNGLPQRFQGTLNRSERISSRRSPCQVVPTAFSPSTPALTPLLPPGSAADPIRTASHVSSMRSPSPSPTMDSLVGTSSKPQKTRHPFVLTPSSLGPTSRRNSPQEKTFPYPSPSSPPSSASKRVYSLPRGQTRKSKTLGELPCFAAHTDSHPQCADTSSQHQSVRSGRHDWSTLFMVEHSISPTNSEPNQSLDIEEDNYVSHVGTQAPIRRVLPSTLETESRRLELVWQETEKQWKGKYGIPPLHFQEMTFRQKIESDISLDKNDLVGKEWRNMWRRARDCWAECEARWREEDAPRKTLQSDSHFHYPHLEPMDLIMVVDAMFVYFQKEMDKRRQPAERKRLEEVERFERKQREEENEIWRIHLEHEPSLESTGDRKSPAPRIERNGKLTKIDSQKLHKKQGECMMLGMMHECCNAKGHIGRTSSRTAREPRMEDWQIPSRTGNSLPKSDSPTVVCNRRLVPGVKTFNLGAPIKRRVHFDAFSVEDMSSPPRPLAPPVHPASSRSTLSPISDAGASFTSNVWRTASMPFPGPEVAVPPAPKVSTIPLPDLARLYKGSCKWLYLPAFDSHNVHPHNSPTPEAIDLTELVLPSHIERACSDQDRAHIISQEAIYEDQEGQIIDATPSITFTPFDTPNNNKSDRDPPPDQGGPRGAIEQPERPQVEKRRLSQGQWQRSEESRYERRKRGPEQETPVDDAQYERSCEEFLELHTQDAWTSYEIRWSALSASPPTQSIGFRDIPWPLLCAATEPESITPHAIAAFLLSPLHSHGKSHKERLRSAMIRWDPGRFEGRWMARIKEDERLRVEEAVGEVYMSLVQLMRGDDSPDSKLARVFTPVPQEPRAIIGKRMPVPDIVKHLVEHGCQDLTGALDLTTFGECPTSQGGNSDIYAGRLMAGGHVAVKALRVSTESIENHKHLKRAARELYTWSSCKHPNVLQLLGLAIFRGRIGMVSSWVDHGTLPRYLNNTENPDRCDLCTQICDGLAYLHSVGIVHGDLKGANVLVLTDGTPVLTDFGSAMFLGRGLQFTETTRQGGLTIRWAAPELLQESGRSSVAADVYALGMTMLEVMTGKAPYYGKTTFVIVSLMNQKKQPERPIQQIPINSRDGDKFWKLLTACWAYEPSERPSAAEITVIMRTITPEGLESYNPS